jgi:hypothetical protein
MQHKIFDNVVKTIFLGVALGYVGISSAHDAGATMDPNGTIANFTGFAVIACTSSGSVPTDYLEASIRDDSLPQDGLLVNLQLIHVGGGINRAISTTDPVSGDGNFSPAVKLHGGNGTYLLLVNKTDAGARKFLVSYHCQSADTPPIHTETDLSVVYQFQ